GLPPFRNRPIRRVRPLAGACGTDADRWRGKRFLRTHDARRRDMLVCPRCRHVAYYPARETHRGLFPPPLLQRRREPAPAGGHLPPLSKSRCAGMYEMGGYVVAFADDVPP